MKLYKIILICLPLLYSINASACWDDDDDDWYGSYDDDYDDDDYDDDDYLWPYWDDDDDWFDDDDDDDLYGDGNWLDDVIVIGNAGGNADTDWWDDYDDTVYGDGIWLSDVVVTPNGAYWVDDDGNEWWSGNSGNTGDDDDPFGDSSDEEEDRTPSDTAKPNMRTPADLKNVASRVVSEISAKYGKQLACCNFGVNTAFQYLFNKNDLDGKRANEMVKYWSAHPEHWQKISVGDAQSLANKGYFVVAGWINSSGSGHVVFVVPGEATYNSGWGGSIPNVMDTGYGMRSTSQPVSRSFGLDKKGNVVFFKYR